jgi:hypothetical protein
MNQEETNKDEKEFKKCLICLENIYSPSNKNYILTDKYGIDEITENICYQCYLSMMKKCACIKGEYGKYKVDTDNKSMVCFYCDEINQKLQQYSKNVKKRQNNFLYIPY